MHLGAREVRRPQGVKIGGAQEPRFDNRHFVLDLPSLLRLKARLR